MSSSKGNYIAVDESAEVISKNNTAVKWTYNSFNQIDSVNELKKTLL